MFNILDIFLVLAFLSTILVTILTQQPSGPEGPVGVWLLLLIPCLFMAILIFMMVGKELLNFVPGGSLIQFITAIGILITFSIAIFGTVDRHQYNWAIQGLVITVPSLILVAGAVIIHQTDFPNLKPIHLLAVILLGAAALTGWGVAAKGIFHYIKKEVEQANQQVQKERKQQDQREQWEIAEYAKLGESPSLYALLQFVWSRNDQIRKQARDKVSGFPQLDEKLIELIDKDNEEAISYIAKLYENPPTTLAPAWARMLKRQLKKWDSLQFDDHAGTWENNLKNYFEGAKKIQMAGGSFSAELRAWHEHLLKCKGLDNLATFVKSLLKTNGKS
jgi:Sec-independent protein translocase protein TatA